MFAVAWSAHAYWQLGRYDDAVDSAARAIAWAGQMDPYNLAVALAYGAITHQLRGDIALTLDCARRVRELCDRHDIAYYGEWGTILHGWCIGDVEGAQQIRVGIGRLRNLGALLRMPYYQSLLAQTLIEAGQLDAAGAVLDGAQATAAVNDDRGWVPELWRLEARRHPGPDGEAILLRAIALAEEQGSIALHGRAANDLASRKRAANASRTQDRLASKAIAPGPTP